MNGVGAELRSLTRLAWRTARTSPARSILVVALIGLVVAVGAVMTSIASASVLTDDEARSRAMGDADIVFAFSSDGAVHYQSGFDVVGEMAVPAVLQTGEESAEDYELRAEAYRNANRVWNQGFDAARAIASIEETLAPPTSLRWTRGLDLQWSDEASGPFGAFGPRGLVLDISQFDPVAAGQMVVLEGRLPERAGEVAIDLRSARGRDLAIGNARTYDGIELTVVGIYGGPVEAGSPFDLVVAEDFERLAEVNAEVVVSYRLYPAPGWLPADAADVVRSISNEVQQPAVARTADRALVPSPDGQTFDWVERPILTPFYGTSATEARVLPTLATVLLSVQIAFVAAAALAVAVRRRSRQYALIGVTGGSPGHVRSLVFAEAALLGASGAVLGVVIAIVAVRYIPYEAPFADGWTWGVVELGLLDVAVPAVIGLGAALVAAWWPAHTVASSPPAALLGGRIPSRRPGVPTLWRAGILLALGSSMTLLLSFQLENSSSTSLLPLVALAVLTMLGGTVLIVGPVLAWFGRRADRLPVLPRLVARDSDRGRTRSWVAVGALMVLTMIPVLIGAATKAYPNSFGERASELDGRIVTVRTQQRWWGPPQEAQPEVSPDVLAEYEAIDTEIGTALAAVGTVGVEFDLLELHDFGLVARSRQGWSSSFGHDVLVATPELVDAFDLSAEMREALADGSVVDIGQFRSSEFAGGDVYLEKSGAGGSVGFAAGTSVEIVRGDAYLNSAVLVPPGHPILERETPTVSGTIRVMADELTRSDEITVRQAANERWAESFSPVEWGRFGPPMDLMFERSWNDGPSAATVRFWSLLVTGVLSLLIALLMAALSAVELDQDLSSMIAAGAAPSLRRRFLGAHTLYHMVLAAVLGVPLAILLYWLATRADDFGPTGPTVPWTVAGVVIVLIPLVVAMFVAALFRNGKPSAPRRMT